MGDVTTWAPTAAGNDLASPGPPDYPSEGQTRSSLNNCMRENMSAVRRLADDGGWFDHGHTYAYVSGTKFQAQNGDFTDLYLPDRRVRAVGTTTGTIYGTVTAVAFSSPHTEVDVLFDSGVLQNESLTVSIGDDPRAVVSGAIVGEIKDLAFEPDMADFPGWLNCGQAVSRTTYAALFSRIGTTWGVGDGSTTFDLPPNGRISIASGADGGTTFTIGETGGAETAAAHTHTISADTHSHGRGSVDNQFEEAAGPPNYRTDSHTHSHGGVTGTGGATSILPPYEVFARIIYAGA